MAMRPIYMSAYVFLFFFGIWKHGSALAVVQRLKCKSKFKKELLTTGHDHDRIRNNTFDQLFLIRSRLMGFASVRKISRGFLLKFTICSIFSDFLSSPLLETNLRKPNTMERPIRELLKQRWGPEFFCWIKAFWATKITNSTNWCVLMPVLPKTF